MKLKASKMELKKLLNGNTEIVLEIEDKQSKFANEINAKKWSKDTQLDVSIDKWYNKRSGGHNRLFWDMCGYLADNINDPLITAYGIYRALIKEYGVSTIYPVEDEMLDMIIKDWESRGDGWLTQVQRKSKLDDKYTVVKFWFGSSVYNSKMFWKLVEGLKQMCRENDVDISHYDTQLQASINALEQAEIAYENKQKQAQI